MIRHYIIALLSVLSVIATSCEHKDLCYTHPHFATIRVVFDWSNIAEDEVPKGMRVQFFGINGNSESWTFDFPEGKDGIIELPEDDYQVLCYNYDTQNITWVDTENYSGYKAITTTAIAPDSSIVSLTPSMLVGDCISFIDLKDIEASEQIVYLVPKKLVCHYSYEVHGIKNLNYITDIRASLSGMTDALILADDKPADNEEATLLFDGKKADTIVTGDFYSFGYMPNHIGNEFRIYIRSRSEKIHIDTHDVTSQIRNTSSSNHRSDVHIIINSNFSIPPDSTKPEGGDNNSMFDVGVDDWQDVNTDIKA